MLLILAALFALLSLGNGEISMHFIRRVWVWGVQRACLQLHGLRIGGGREGGGGIAMAQLEILALTF